MKKPRMKRIPISEAEALYMLLVSRIVEMCPPSMRMVAIVHSPRIGPMVTGSCCEACTGALVHMIAEVVDDPRKEDQSVVLH